MDKDTGWQSGADTEAKFEAEKVWPGTLFAYSSSSGTKYRGSLNDYTPVNLATKEKFSRHEAALDYRLLGINASGYASFSGIGYRDMDLERGSNCLANDFQLHTWYYFPGGADYVLTIDADAAVQLLVSIKMKTVWEGILL